MFLKSFRRSVNLGALSIGCVCLLTFQFECVFGQSFSTRSAWWPFQSTTENSEPSPNDSETPINSTNASANNLKQFKVYWNIPTTQCQKYGLNFSQVSSYGIVQNNNDDFRGEEIALLYDPGEFPALLHGGSQRIKRNGGLPQEGDLQRHLHLFEKHLTEKLVPDSNFNGVGIIDFEHWRPVFHQNFGSLEDYRAESKDLVRKQHPFWSADAVEQEAARSFDKAAQEFFVATLKSAKRLRPYGKWGYYGFPLCFNFTPHNNRAKCKASIIKDNDRINWLFSGSGAIYPSLYYKKNGLTLDQRAEFMAGRTIEAVRLAQGTPVIPYTWLKYYDQTSEFVTKGDFLNSIRVPKKHGAAGIIIWGASKDVNSEKRCKQMLDFLETVVGPVVQQMQGKNGDGNLILKPQNTTIRAETTLRAIGTKIWNLPAQTGNNRAYSLLKMADVHFEVIFTIRVDAQPITTRLVAEDCRKCSLSNIAGLKVPELKIVSK